jgi:hypothetical protein
LNRSEQPSIKSYLRFVLVVLLFTGTAVLALYFVDGSSSREVFFYGLGAAAGYAAPNLVSLPFRNRRGAAVVAASLLILAWILTDYLNGWGYLDLPAWEGYPGVSGGLYLGAFLAFLQALLPQPRMTPEDARRQLRELLRGTLLVAGLWVSLAVLVLLAVGLLLLIAYAVGTLA